MSDWQDISTLTGDDGTVLLAKWYEDDCSGYYGESRWLWVISGCREENWWWCDFADDEFTPEYHSKPTHWQPMPSKLNP